MEKSIIVKTLAQLNELHEYIKKNDFFAYDTETDGVDKESHIIGFSLCCDVDLAYYVILYAWDVAQQKLVEVIPMDAAKNIIEELRYKNLIMQNAPFDCSMTLNNFNIELMPNVIHDTMIGGHILNENRANGLKERGVELFGEDARKEQKAMKESVTKNGGVLSKKQYELYKADADLIAYYGAKDAILTLKVFFHDSELIYEQGLDNFFYQDESMPLLKGPTYDMNTAGLCVDPKKLMKLRMELEAECQEAKGFIYKEITPIVKQKYPGTGKTNVFNIGATQQRAWLLYDKLGNEFNTLTKGGRELCKALGLKMPYSFAAKREFIRVVTENKDRIWEEAKFNKKTKKMSRPKKVGDPWTYMACGKESLQKLAHKYKWVAKYLEYAKNLKLLNTYVEGIQSRMKYNVIRPSFLQHGTTSGRYSCKNPNFQNLPRDDKRVKSCIVARAGMVFVGADYSQLEPRCFASHSGDERLLACFNNKEDFYSVVGMEVFERYDCSLKKGDKDFFRDKYKQEGQQSKVIALAAPYGQTPAKLSPQLGVTMDRAAEIIDAYFEKWPKVKQMQLRAHEAAKKNGVVYNMFGRPRRIPKAMDIPKIYGKIRHSELPYEYRTLLNLAVNHEIQSTGASIMNRSAIAVWKKIKEYEKIDARWRLVKIVLQVHDELVLEGPAELAEDMVQILKNAMENTVSLPGVQLIAEPKIASNLADLK